MLYTYHQDKNVEDFYQLRPRPGPKGGYKLNEIFFQDERYKTNINYRHGEIPCDRVRYGCTEIKYGGGKDKSPEYNECVKNTPCKKKS